MYSFLRVHVPFLLCSFFIAVPSFASVCSVLSGAEARYAKPSAAWFHNTQKELREEAKRIEAAFDARGPEYAETWKTYLHWDLLAPNLKEGYLGDFQKIALVRRWLYSNQEGLESAFFAKIRRTIDEHLDAVFTFGIADFKAEFVKQLSQLRLECDALVKLPSEENGVAFGRTLGFFERTRQLAAETNYLRKHLAHANAQLIVSEAFIQRLMEQQNKEFSNSQPVSDTVWLPTGLGGALKQVNLEGTATTTGTLSLQLIDNPDQAQINLIFQGNTYSTTNGYQGPVTTSSVTHGPVSAVQQLFLTPNGMVAGKTTATNQVETCVTGICAPLLLRGIAKRRANRPDIRQAATEMSRLKASEKLQAQIVEQVDTGLAQMKQQSQSMSESLSGFSDVTGPFIREGVDPKFVSTRSTKQAVTLHFLEQQPMQFGATVDCERKNAGKADLVSCVHQSFFNNMAETASGGKRYNDLYFQEAAKIMQAELPLELVVHDRAPRWAVIARKLRPLTLNFETKDTVVIQMYSERVEYDGKSYDTNLNVHATYDFSRDDFGDFQLVRKGDLIIDSTLPKEIEAFFREKYDAFLAPILNGKGVIIPDGGYLGALKGVKVTEITGNNGWVVISAVVPESVIADLKRVQAEKK